jgi:hypothetical protein
MDLPFDVTPLPANSSPAVGDPLPGADAKDTAATAPVALENVDLSVVDSASPDGEAGMALALACGLLESFTFNRPTIKRSFARVQGDGAGVFLFFDRLDGSTKAFNFDRRRDALVDDF